jgi:hypothetical protein
MVKVNIIQSDKTVSETLADLRKVFRDWAIEEWEPIPDADGRSYSVRYLRGKQWVTISSQMQPNKAMNLRVVYHVINNLKIWEQRGVTGIAQGVTFMGGALVTTGAGTDRESFEESCATLGVDPDASVEEIEHVFKLKAQYYHPDKTQGDPEKTERFKRMQKAYEYILKVKKVKQK